MEEIEEIDDIEEALLNLKDACGSVLDCVPF